MHASERVDHYGPSYGPGDVIGCYIQLSYNIAENEIRFFKNGVPLGAAYTGAEVLPGVYFPAISVYKKVDCELISLCPCAMFVVIVVMIVVVHLLSRPM